MMGGSIGHCTTVSASSSTGAAAAAFDRVVSTRDCVSSLGGSWTGDCAPANDRDSTNGCVGIGIGAASALSCEGPLAPGTPACSPSLGNDEATPDCPASTCGSVLTGVVVTMAFSAPLLRARLTPAMSVQRAAFSAMLRSVSWTLAGGATFCAVAIGRV
jgi:hypothetical protein